MAPAPSKVKSTPTSPTTPNGTKMAKGTNPSPTSPLTSSTSKAPINPKNAINKNGFNRQTNPFLVAVSVFIIVAAFGVFRYLEPLQAFGPSAILEKYLKDKGYVGYGNNIEVSFKRTSLVKGSGADDSNGDDANNGNTDATSSSSDPNDIDIRYPRVVAKRKIKANEPILSIPRSEVIDVQHIIKSEIAKLIAYDNSAHIQQLGDASFQTIFYFAFYMMYERRRGKDSPLYGWIQTLPKTFAHEGGAIYWPDHIAHCLDRMASAEFIAIKSIIGTVAQGANICCELPEEATAGATVCEAISKQLMEPFTEEEARWGMSVYLRYNFNDQAIIPTLNYIKRSNRAEGIFAQNNDKTQTIDIVSLKDLEEGEEPVWNYARGPGSSLMLYGFFDNATDVAEFPFRLPQAKENTLIHKMCQQQLPSLLFKRDGKPKEQLVKCMGAILAQTPEQKKNINNMRTKDPMMLIDVYGNLTVIAHRHAMSIVNASTNDMCSLVGLNEKDEAAVIAYMQYSNEFYNTITQYLFEETDRLCIASGIPSRLKPKKEDVIENAEEEQSAGEAYDEFANKEEEDVEDGTEQQQGH